jgi:hypothetical protein
MKKFNTILFWHQHLLPLPAFFLRLPGTHTNDTGYARQQPKIVNIINFIRLLDREIPL